MSELLPDTINQVEVLETQDINKKSDEPASLSLDALLLLISKKQILDLEDKARDELKGVHERNVKIEWLHTFIQTLQAAMDDKGQLDCKNNPEIQGLLSEAKEYGVKITDGKHKFSTQEATHLVENAQLACSDHMMENDLQMQKVQKYNGNRNELYQMLIELHKTHDRIKKSHAEKLIR